MALDSGSNEIINEVVNIDSADQSDDMVTFMDVGLYEAAKNCEFDAFKKKAKEDLHLLLTPNRNTILHINIISTSLLTPKNNDILPLNIVYNSYDLSVKKKYKSVTFLGQILDLCPQLLNQVNIKGDTPLHVAARYGHVPALKLLIKRAKKFDLHNHNVILDTESGVENARQMLRMTNEKKETALHLAVRHDYMEAVTLLAGEDPDFPYSPNNSGETPLYLAANNYFTSKMASVILENCMCLAYDGPNGRTALHAAVAKGNRDLTEKILKKKESLTKVRDEYGRTALHYASYFGRLKCIEKLLEVDKSAVYIGDKERNMTALLMAASQGNVKIIKKIILDFPDSCEQVDNRGWNVLHFAVISTTWEDFNALLINIPLLQNLVDEKDAKGNTCLDVHRVLLFSEGNLDMRRVMHFSAVNLELKKEVEDLVENARFAPYPGRSLISKALPEIDLVTDPIKSKARESQLVVAALIATVTFAAGFTLPGGHKNENGPNQGTAILSRNSAFMAFIITNSTAMVLSLSSVFVHFIMVLPLYKYSTRLLNYSSWFTMLAMTFMVFAFLSGMLAVLTTSLRLATCFVCLSFFVIVFFMMFKA